MALESLERYSEEQMSKLSGNRTVAKFGSGDKSKNFDEMIVRDWNIFCGQFCFCFFQQSSVVSTSIGFRPFSVMTVRRLFHRISRYHILSSSAQNTKPIVRRRKCQREQIVLLQQSTKALETKSQKEFCRRWREVLIAMLSSRSDSSHGTHSFHNGKHYPTHGIRFKVQSEPTGGDANHAFAVAKARPAASNAAATAAAPGSGTPRIFSCKHMSRQVSEKHSRQ